MEGDREATTGFAPAGGGEEATTRIVPMEEAGEAATGLAPVEGLAEAASTAAGKGGSAEGPSPDAIPTGDAPASGSRYEPHASVPDLASHRHARTLRGHEREVVAVRFDPSGAFLASASADGTARVWEVAGGRLFGVLVGHAGGLSDVAWAPSGYTGATTNARSEGSDGERALAGPGDATPPPAAPASLLLATASDDHTARLWRTRDGACAGVLSGHTHQVCSVDFSPGGNMLATASVDETVIVWSVADRAPLRAIPAHCDPVASVRFAPSDAAHPSLVTAGLDGVVRLWSSVSGRCLGSLLDHGALPATYATFSRNGRFVAAAYHGGGVIVWDPITRTPVRRLRFARDDAPAEGGGDGGPETALAASCATLAFLPPPGGRQPLDAPAHAAILLATCADHSVHAWDLNGPRDLSAPEAPILGLLRGAPRGGGDDGGTGHEDALLGLDASPQGLIATSAHGGDPTIRIWVPVPGSGWG